MRIDSILLFGSIFLASLLIFVSKPRNSKPHYTNKAIGEINVIFQKDLQAFTDAAASFHEATLSYGTLSYNDETLQQKYHDLRTSFKKIEYLVEYLDKEASDKMLNGAPLPKLETKVADLVVLQPKGLQVIDELIASEELSEEIEALRDISEKLKKDVFQLQQYLRTKRFSDRQFFEATRQAIIRLATLGITGFDTPGTTLGIKDASVVLKTLKKNIEYYKGELENIQRSEVGTKIHELLSRGIAQVEMGDFDTFNRLNFLTEILNPLYKELLNMHTSLGYETINEVTRYQPAVNYYSENIFDSDFLNTFYYASIPNDSTFQATKKLGKLLFYDPVLSSNNKMACASCHNPEKAFTDGLATSLSNTGVPLKRNAMTLNYTTYAAGFFHDMRTKRLEDQFEHVILSTDEFNTNYKEIIKKLRESETYTQKFKEAFPNQKQAILANNIDYALVAYVMSLNTFDNPIDLYIQGKDVNLADEVVRGFNLFSGKAACATCHFMPLFSGTVPPLYIESETEVLGVPEHKETPNMLDGDLGRLGNGRTQEVAGFMANAFKTPTLRNISKTAPYMHNGVFNTLDEIMLFYNEGGGAGRGIVLEHQTLAPDPLHLSDQEISDIIAFMRALDDSSIFSPPPVLPRDFKTEAMNQRRLIN